jgi:hypothetical protein
MADDTLTYNVLEYKAQCDHLAQQLDVFTRTLEQYQAQYRELKDTLVALARQCEVDLEQQPAPPASASVTPPTSSQPAPPVPTEVAKAAPEPKAPASSAPARSSTSAPAAPSSRSSGSSDAGSSAGRGSRGSKDEG